MKILYSIYHWLWAFGSAVFYRFPGDNIKVIAVTGTKGKSSTTEIINAIFEEAGYKTALSNTIRFKIGDQSEDNMYKMSMPGRFFMQRFLRRAVDANCDVVIMEITSQGALQHRNKFISLDTFIFTNLAPEHIESHGSYEKYVAAKVGIASAVKKDGAIIVNSDDKESPKFLNYNVEHKLSYSLKDAEPFTILAEGIDFTLDGKNVHSPLSGEFNLSNILAAIKAAQHFGIPDSAIINALEDFKE